MNGIYNITIKYDFDDNNDYEYEADLYDYINSLSNDEICEITKEIYTEDDKYNDLLKEQNYDVSDIKKDDPELFKDLFFSIDYTDLYDYLEEDIKNFFENDAKEAFKDSLAYQKDPYSYNGVRRSDFF